MAQPLQSAPYIFIFDYNTDIDVLYKQSKYQKLLNKKMQGADQRGWPVGPSCLSNMGLTRLKCVLIDYFQSVEGSTTLFTALLKKCLDRDVIAIGNYIPRRNTPPVIVALLPQVMGWRRSFPGGNFILILPINLTFILILTRNNFILYPNGVILSQHQWRQQG